MFDLQQFPQIINHLQKISPNMYRVKSNEIMLHCPFCNDAQRKNAHSHGHLYLSTESPVFHCFRCNTSGILISLLLETDFTDDETIKELRKYVKFKFSKDYFKDRKRLINKTDLYNKIKQLHDQFYQNNKHDYEIFKQYINKRIGSVIDIVPFLIYPDYIYQQYLSVGFMSHYEILSCWRNISNLDSNFRYINKSSYFFQAKDFNKYQRIVMTEGPFDILNAYLYINQFDDGFFLSLNSSRYVKETENLIIQDLLIGNYEINIIFDSSVNHKSLIYKLNRLSYLNNNIMFRYWKPVIGNDIADFPKITEILI